jgi:anti-sigma B factor antagonist
MLPAPRSFVMALYTSTRRIDDAIIVDCAGRIVFGDETAKLREAVYPLLKDYRSITLNLASVSYMDSGGLGTLVSLYTSARNRGGKINLAGLNHRVTHLLNLTKLATVFEIYANVEDAVRGLAASS